MASHKDILVITTNSGPDLKVKKYIRPVTSHLVAGTNLFSDFFASFSDVFGGKSQSYQRQLSSLYNEAIESLKLKAYEIGANCIIGLNVDLDEISGKGKSMFMITAIGTAVVIEQDKISIQEDVSKREIVNVETINNLRKRKTLIERVKSNNLKLNENAWNFIIENKVHEIHDFIITSFQTILTTPQDNSENIPNFRRYFYNYIDCLPFDMKVDILYNSVITSNNQKLLENLYDAINEHDLLDFTRLEPLIKSNNFDIQKKALKILLYDKSSYTKEDLLRIQEIHDYIKDHFTERGNRSMKKQMLTGKEKEVWICECSKTNDLGTYCSNCQKDIYGFTSSECSPPNALKALQEKIEIISECLH